MHIRRTVHYLTGEQKDRLEEQESEAYDAILDRLEAEFVAEMGERPITMPSFEDFAVKELEKMKHDAQD